MVQRALEKDRICLKCHVDSPDMERQSSAPFEKRGPTMSDYRLYFLDHADHIQRAIDLDCALIARGVAIEVELTIDHLRAGPTFIGSSLRGLRRANLC